MTARSPSTRRPCCASASKATRKSSTCAARTAALQDARVVTAMPRGEFEQAALAAVRDWQGPASRGEPRRETRRFDFRLPDSLLGEVPATLLASAPFPMAACVERTTGRVVLEVETLASGQVREARILEASPPGLFDATALAIARGSRLSPAYRDAQPIAATALLTLHFDPEPRDLPGFAAVPTGTSPLPGARRRGSRGTMKRPFPASNRGQPCPRGGTSRYHERYRRRPRPCPFTGVPDEARTDCGARRVRRPAGCGRRRHVDLRQPAEQRHPAESRHDARLRLAQPGARGDRAPRQRVHRLLHLRRRADPHQPPLRRGLHRAELLRGQRPGRERLHLRQPGEGTAVQGRLGLRAGRHRGRDRQGRRRARGRRARRHRRGTPGGADEARAGLRGRIEEGQGRPAQVRARLALPGRPALALQVPPLRGRAPGVRAGARHRRLRRRPGQLPVPALVPGHVDPARLRGRQAGEDAEPPALRLGRRAARRRGVRLGPPGQYRPPADRRAARGAARHVHAVLADALLGAARPHDPVLEDRRGAAAHGRGLPQLDRELDQGAAQAVRRAARPGADRERAREGAGASAPPPVPSTRSRRPRTPGATSSSRTRSSRAARRSTASSSSTRARWCAPPPSARSRTNRGCPSSRRPGCRPSCRA